MFGFRTTGGPLVVSGAAGSVIPLSLQPKTAPATTRPIIERKAIREIISFASYRLLMPLSVLLNGPELSCGNVHVGVVLHELRLNFAARMPAEVVF